MRNLGVFVVSYSDFPDITATWLVSMARLAVHDGDFALAEQLYSDAEKLAEATYGLDSSIMEIVLKDMKSFYEQFGRPEQLEQIAEKLEKTVRASRLRGGD